MRQNPSTSLLSYGYSMDTLWIPYGNIIQKFENLRMHFRQKKLHITVKPYFILDTEKHRIQSLQA